MSAILEVRWRPLLFSAPMILALLAGTKTQTRRLLRVPEWLRDEYPRFGAYELHKELDCPYGRPGDRFWVKEGIRSIGGGQSVYIADGSLTVADAWPWKVKALSGLYCPRGLSRIYLEVTDVRVQRLRDISEDDARAEGVEPIGPPLGADQPIIGMPGRTNGSHPYTLAYACLWDEINGDRDGCAWIDNPFVWVVTFKRIDKEGAPLA